MGVGGGGGREGEGGKRGEEGMGTCDGKMSVNIKREHVRNCTNVTHFPVEQQMLFQMLFHILSRRQ